MTRVKKNISLPPKLEEAAQRKSQETSVPLSAAIQRLLAHWILTGELPPATELQTVIGEGSAQDDGAQKGGRKAKRSK